MVRILRRAIAIMRLGAVVGGSGLVAAAVPAAAADIRDVYNVSVSGVRMGVLEMAANVDNNAYAATGSISSRGIAGILFPFTLSGTSAGRVVGIGDLQPVRYSGTQKDDDRRDISIRYTRGVPTFVEWTPPRKVRKHDIPPGQQGGALDPVSTAFAILQPLPQSVACNRTLLIYDGSKRSRIRIGAPQVQGATVVCNGNYARVAGFSPKQMREKVDFPFTITYDAVDGLLKVRRIELDSVIGYAVMQKR